MSAKIDIRLDHLTIVQDILHKHLPQGISVYVFGSRATWNAKDYSDLDLALLKKKPKPTKIEKDILLNLENDFEESDLPWKVDLVDLSAITPKFRAIVEKDKVELPLEANVKGGGGYLKKYKLKSLGNFFGGVTSIKKIDYGHGTSFLTYKNIYLNSKVNIEELDLMNVNQKDLEKRACKYGDIFFTASSETPNEVAMSSVLLDEVKNLTFNGFCKRFRLSDFRTLEPRYARYLFRGAAFRSEAYQYATGDTRFNISQESLGQISIKIPPILEQKAIAHVLGSLDDKIELNRKMNETLEAMAQALFKSWFVDFDPVIDNALKAGNPIPETLAKKAQQRADLIAQQKQQPHTTNPDIASHFPSEFEYTKEIGWIPKGWKVRTILNLSEKLSKGTTPKESDISKAKDDPTIPFLKVKDLTNDGYIKREELQILPRSIHESILKRSIIKENDILFSIAGTIGRTAIVSKELDNSNINQALAFIRVKDARKANFLLQLLKSENIQSLIQSKIVQAVQANVSLSKLGNLPALNMKEDVYFAWFEKTSGIYIKILTLRNNIETLSKLRDTLLPKLLSGELCIPDAKQFIKEQL